MKNRTATVNRKTRETDITVSLDLDGTGKSSIKTDLPFLDHMLELLSRHSLIDLNIAATGDLEVDYHHTVEDLGLALGEALDQALGSRRGIQRYGWCYVPMDEALCRVVIDLGGRPYLVKNMACRKRRILDFELSLFDDFFQAFMVQARMNLHIDQLIGVEAHHAYEAVFKALARALRMACTPDARDKGIPSSKGTI
ncbi:MAG: imidazoleglycerol-phosphate dehydratase HisB [Verrucomicrobia bacterium]|nr:imidazoleglycerol-phosphate dehydratase HisB [Verrucomicrobiota bacterium]